MREQMESLLKILKIDYEAKDAPMCDTRGNKHKNCKGVICGACPFAEKEKLAAFITNLEACIPAIETTVLLVGKVLHDD